MTIYGKDQLYISGIKKILRQLSREEENRFSSGELSIYVTSGMNIVEIYSLFFTRPPAHYSVFIAAERHFDSLTLLFPGLVKLCLPAQLRVDELSQALKVMNLLSVQNDQDGYHPGTFKFTSAEQQIMRLLLRGHSLEDIARIRGVSPTTVSVQRNGLMKRTGTKSLQELCSLYRAMRAREQSVTCN